MSSIAVLQHPSCQLSRSEAVTRGRELSELAIIPDGGMLIRDGRITSLGQQ